MSLAGELALSAALRIEQSLGRRAGLRALLALLDSLGEGPVRAKAIGLAMRYAAEVEPERLDALAPRWSLEEEHGAQADALAVIRMLGPSSLEIAEAEVERTHQAGGALAARARYALGRVLELRGDDEGARIAFSAARRHESLRASAAAREAQILLRHGEREAAAELARSALPAESAPPEERLALAVCALQSGGRYARSAALDVLEVVARDARHAASAGEHAAAHAEALGRALTEIERDRVEAVLARHPDAMGKKIASARVDAIARGVPALEDEAPEHARRARLVLEGGGPGPRPSGGRALTGWLALSAIAALRRGDAAHAILREAAQHVRAGARVEGVLWLAVELGLARSEASVQGEAKALCEACMAGRGDPPPMGLTVIAGLLARAGHDVLAESVWRRAAARREPGAKEHLILLLRHRGWEAARAGERDRAITLLKRARELAS